MYVCNVGGKFVKASCYLLCGVMIDPVTPHTVTITAQKETHFEYLPLVASASTLCNTEHRSREPWRKGNKRRFYKATKKG